MTDARGSGPPGSQPPQPPDLLADVVGLASQEGALTGDGLASFLEALRARALLVLAERTEPLENRLRALEAEAASLRAETAWRRDSMTSLEAELAWRRESMAALEQNVRALGQQVETLLAELRRASDAHAALLAHHRELVDRMATQLVSIASLSPLRSREARRRLLALAELLRADSR